MKVINIQDIDIPEDCATYDELAQFADKIAELAVNYLEVEPVRHGRWINDRNDIPMCSICGYYTPYDRAIDDYEYGNFCPNCGARMESENEID